MDLAGARVAIVSGKGGTGKTTVACALALGAARAGRSVLLVELEGRQGAARLLGLRPATFEERPTPLGFSLESVGPRDALLEYLRLFYGITRVAGPLLRSRAVELATEAAPGFRDMMLAGKLYEVAEWRRGSPRGRGRPRYDLVVADAPPTGQIVPFLSAPRVFAELIRMGRPHGQARRIDAFLRRRALILLVTTAEELAVTETLEARDAIGALGMRVGPVIVNRLLEDPLPRGTVRAFERLAPADARRLAQAAGAPMPQPAAATALEVARTQRARAREASAQVGRLGDSPVIRLPFLFSERFGPAEVARLAATLEEA
ncbi:MAG TPA: ArsA-related P-loop ATPase [Actinomycetota bacterium]|nr:ArsA-related P-loop ATPase [Actinomycetota bacterium]